MQSKKGSLVESAIQVAKDIVGNIGIAIPVAYYIYEIKLDVIYQIFIIMLVYNFFSTYLVRRVFENGGFMKLLVISLLLA